MNYDRVSDLLTILDNIEPDSGEQFSPTRYPYTYAYDFLRFHAAEFGIPADVAGSRSAVSRWLRDYVESPHDKDTDAHELLVRQFADAYLSEHGIRRTL